MPTALIVEDEPEANRLLSLLVQLRKYRTESAWTGQQAISLLDDMTPDVIFLDLMLPDTNGYELFRRLKARRETALLPVIVVSARLAEENRTRCYQLGALAYVAKPYTPDQIFEVLAEAERWRTELREHDGRRQFWIGSDEELAARELALLRSQLVAYSKLSLDEIGTLVGSLREISSSAAAWSAKREVEQVAQVSYEVNYGQLKLKIQDESGWFDAGDLTEAAAGFSPSLDKVFDVVGRDDAGREVELIKRFEPAEPRPNETSPAAPASEAPEQEPS